MILSFILLPTLHGTSQIQYLNLKYFLFGKLRASYGVVGVQPSAHRFETLAEGGFSYSTYSDPLVIDSFGGGFRLDNNLGNPNLKPEIKTEWEIGTDLRFLDNDLIFSFTYYNNKIEDILLNVDLVTFLWFFHPIWEFW